MLNYAHISAVLSDLLKKGTKFVWTAAVDRAFLDLKSHLLTQPVLRPPDYDPPFQLTVDASDLAVGATLFRSLTASSTQFAISAKSSTYIRNVTQPLRKML